MNNAVNKEQSSITKPVYIASCSFGKDSIATILLAMLHNEPLDRIVSVEVMFDNKRGISGEDPEHIQWVKEIAIPRLKELTGIDTDIVRNEKDDYLTEFFKKRGEKTKYPERIGKYQGFLLGGFCRMNSIGKMTPMRRYWRQFNSNYISYVGIAADEPERLARLTNKSVSLLAKYGYTERMAFELCKKYDLLSPNYANSSRGGCWFCPNNNVSGFCELRRKNPELWEELRKLSHVQNTISDKFCYDDTFETMEKKMNFWERQQIIKFEL